MQCQARDITSGSSDEAFVAIWLRLRPVRSPQVHLAAEVCSVVVTTLVLEGWSARLDPSICLMVRQISSERREAETHNSPPLSPNRPLLPSRSTPPRMRHLLTRFRVLPCLVPSLPPSYRRI